MTEAGCPLDSNDGPHGLGSYDRIQTKITFVGSIACFIKVSSSRESPANKCRTRLDE